MNRVESKERDVTFIFCRDPVTIDKRKAWGEHHENIQHAPNGAFLKLDTDGSVCHLVQPNEDLSAPVGWTIGDNPNTFDKAPIWVADEKLEPGTTKKMLTLDGPIESEITEPSMVCYNDKHGQPDLQDGWVETVTNLERNYALEPISAPG